MQLEPKHLDSSKTKVIGQLNGQQVYMLTTTGGLVIVAAAGSKHEPLGVGSHPALAKFIAKKAHPDLEITELNKSDDVPERFLADLAPRWEAITQQMRRASGF